MYVKAHYRLLYSPCIVTDTTIEMGNLFWKGRQFSLVCYALPAWESPTDFLPELYYGNVNSSLRERRVPQGNSQGVSSV